MKFDNKYIDFENNETELTEKELEWFYSVVTKFHQLPEATGIVIVNRNHEELSRKNREAYGIFWTTDLDAYDMMYRLSREVQCPMNCKYGFEHILKSKGYVYTGISNKKGTKRPTVDSFTKEHLEGTYVLIVANHYVCSKDGHYFDTWDSGECSMYGYWVKEE